uniref:Complex 1 LYR protein domain-containing protein n=1 Tax=Oncorhynchus kisutch TaxID=8019 RepID=A0A8C7IBT3_ONCKI
MVASLRAQVLSLYRLLIICVFSFRMYTLRRVQDSIRANRSVEDPMTVEQLLNQGRDNIDINQRQVDWLHAIIKTASHCHASVVVGRQGSLVVRALDL